MSIAGALRSLLRALTADRRGAVAIVLAFVMSALVGMMALGAEVASWHHTKRTLQAAVDAAALSGALESVNNDNERITNAAKADAKRVGFVEAPPTSTITVNHPPTSGPSKGDLSAVEVVATHRPQRLLSKLFIKDDPTIQVRSVALRQGDSACVLALSRTEDSAIGFYGASSVNLPDCALATNSASDSSIVMAGLTFLKADSLWTVGDIAKGWATFLTLKQKPITGADPFPDPYAGLNTTPPLGCDHTNFTISGANPSLSLSPGTYCGGIKMGGANIVTLQPGVYWLIDGDLRVTGSTIVNGNGVTLVLTQSSFGQVGRFTIEGASLITLTAPKGAGARFPGLAVIQDARAQTGKTGLDITGASWLSVAGAIYMPRQDVSWMGAQALVSSDCTQIVANRVNFAGLQFLSFAGCPAMGVRTVGTSDARLVE